MLTPRLSRAIAAAILLTPLSALADDGDANSTRAIHLKSGTVIEARVIEVDETAIMVEISGIPGSRASIRGDLVVASDLFDILLASRDPKSADEWLEMARNAASLGLHVDRMWSLRNAARLDPKRAPEIQKDIDACREVCSDERLGIARHFLQAGELDRARRYLDQAMREYDGCIAAEQAKELSQAIDRAIDEAQAKAAAALAARRRIQESHEELEVIRDLQERGASALNEGRNRLERPGAAIARFDEALALFEHAWGRLTGYKPPETPPDGGTHEDFAGEAKRLRDSLRDDMVAAHLELGHAYLTRSSFVKAARHAGEAAALDPEDPGVLALRIAIAAARSRGR